MSLIRPIWNDGQGLATPDLQRGGDAAGAADDHVYETVFTPGAVQKRVTPLLEETATVNPRLLTIPSTPSLSPAGANGAVRVQPCQLIAGSPTSQQQIALAATSYTGLDSALITSNGSGSIRYDLIYATVYRAVSVSGTRKIKSATDGTLSSQSIALADVAAVTLGTNVGFLTGATAPTLSQINAALPADTAPSSATFGSFSFPLCFVTVANGYSSGTVLAQNSAGGSTYITQAWSGGAMQGHRVRGPRPASIYYGVASEKPTSALTTGVQGAERWGSDGARFFAHFKVLPASSNAIATAAVVDNSIDWRRRFIYGFYSYISSATALPIESAAYSPASTTVMNEMYLAAAPGTAFISSGALAPLWTGTGTASSTASWLMPYLDSGTPAMRAHNLSVYTDGSLRVVRNSALLDGANGDVFAVVLWATDQLTLNF
jgi:hypothetical protein